MQVDIKMGSFVKKNTNMPNMNSFLRASRPLIAAQYKARCALSKHWTFCDHYNSCSHLDIKAVAPYKTTSRQHDKDDPTNAGSPSLYLHLPLPLLHPRLLHPVGEVHHAAHHHQGQPGSKLALLGPKNAVFKPK